MPIDFKFQQETPYYREKKVCSYGSDPMTKMATMAKPFKNLLHGNQKADGLETKCVALRVWDLPSLFK